MIQLLPVLGPIITQALSKLIPDQAARDTATQAILSEVQQNESKLAEVAASVAKSDAESESALTRMARPMVVVWSLGTISMIVLEALVVGQSHIIPALKEVPDQMWNLIYIGVGGYMLLRTADKAVAQIVSKR